MTIGERIKIERNKKGLSQAALGELLQLTQQAIGKWEKNLAEPDSETLIKLSDIFEIPISLLLGKEEKEPINVFSTGTLLVFEEIGSVRAGYNGAINEIPTGRKIEIPASMLKGGEKEDYFALRVTGNSMYPKLLDGDTILCKRCDSVDSGDLAVIIYNGDEATVKKVNYITGQDWLELIPINPEYPTKRIEGIDLELCRVIGKVVKLVRDL